MYILFKNFTQVYLCITVALVNFIYFANCYDYKLSTNIKHQRQDEMNNIAPPSPGWIDPFDMLGDSSHYSDPPETQSGPLITQSDVENYVLNKRCIHCESFLKRFVNMFLQAVRLKDSSTSSQTMRLVKVEFPINEGELYLLKQFGQNGESRVKLESVYRVLNNIFSQSGPPPDQCNVNFQQLLKWVKNIFRTLGRSPEMTVVSSVSLMLIGTLWLVFKSHAYRLALFTIFVTVFFAGFGFTWIRMYEEQEAVRFAHLMTHGNAPYHCSGQPMLWYEHLFYKFFGTDCYEFYKIRDVNPMVKISPTVVLSETISSMIIKPAVNIGLAYGNFISSVINSVPWYLKPIAVPLAFVIPLIFVLTVCALLCDYQIAMSPFGFYLTPSWAHIPALVQHKRRQYIEDLSDRNNRNVSAYSEENPVIGGNKDKSTSENTKKRNKFTFISGEGSSVSGGSTESNGVEEEGSTVNNTREIPKYEHVLASSDHNDSPTNDNKKKH